MKSKFFRLLMLAGVLCLSGTLNRAIAQVDSGRILGLVLDAKNASIAGATITVVDERTNEERTTQSNTDGAYEIVALKPSSYTIKVSAEQFAPAEQTGIQLTVGQEIHRNFMMGLATLSSSISVVESIESAIDTGSAAIGGNVSERQVADLAINGREVSQLYVMTPGAVNFGGGTFDDFRFNGRSFEENALRFDGIEAGGIISNNPSNIGGEMGSVFRLQASLENVQEFRVDSSNYPAEFGTGSGGQISLITKSGGNSFHGSLFEYFRNDALDARNEFDGVKPSVLRLNQFGGSMGGPIKKDKLFFFAGMETLKQRTSQPFVQNTLSDEVRAARDCAAGEKPSATAVTCINPAIRPLLAAFPVGFGQQDTDDTSSPFFDRTNISEPGSIDEYSGNLRFDYQASDKDKIYLRYNRDQGYGAIPFDSTGSRSTETIVPQNLVLAYTRVQSATMINEAKFGFNGSKTRVTGVAPQIPGLNLDGVTISLTGVTSLDGNSSYASPTGQIKVSSAFSGQAAPYTNYSLSFIDNLTLLRGNHNIKMGVEIRPQRIENAFLGGTTYSFTGIQGFMAGTPSTVTVLGNTNDPSPFTGKSGYFHMRQTFYIGYVQDEWKIRPNFTMSYGLRYEYYSPLHEENNKVLWFDVPTATLIPNYPSDWYKMRTTNFGPRLGLSWSPNVSAGKTVFRI
jgi:hypothetical protein